MKFFCLVLLCVLGLAHGQDVRDHFDCLSGVPVGTTEDEAETGPKPFRIEVQDLTGPITPGGKYTVTIWGNRPFSGFYLRAQYPAGTHIGNWLAESYDVFLGLCENPGDILFSVSGEFNINGSSTASATWEAPNTFSMSRIEFVATVVETDGFWLNVLSSIQVAQVEPAQLPVAQETPVDQQPAQGTGGATDTQIPPPDQSVVDPEVVHDYRREEELEAAWQEKKAQMIDNEEANSEGTFNLVELLEQEAHEKEIHDEQMAYEREQEERERIRMERLRAEIRDKEEYDRQKAEQQRLLEMERERERQIEEEEINKLLILEENRENDAVKGKVTGGASFVSINVAAMLIILTATLL